MIEIIDLLKPKNGGSFKLIEDIDIAVTGYESLADAVSHFATTAMIEAINLVLSGKQDKLTTAQLTACNSGITSELVAQITLNTTAIAGKADASALTTATASLQAQIDNIVSGSTADSEVINARVDTDGTTYNTIKARIDADDEKHTANEADIESILVSNDIVQFAPKVEYLGKYIISSNGTVTANESYNAYIYDLTKISEAVVAVAPILGYYSSKPKAGSVASDNTRHENQYNLDVTVTSGKKYLLICTTFDSIPSVTNKNAKDNIRKQFDDFESYCDDEITNANENLNAILIESVNKFNAYSNDIITNAYIGESSIITGQTDSYQISHLIEVKSGVTYKFNTTDTYGGNAGKMAFYRTRNAVEYTIITGTASGGFVTFTPTENGYIRFNQPPLILYTQMFCESSDYPVSYTPYSTKINDNAITVEVSNINIKGNITKNQVDFIEHELSENIFDKNDVTTGYYLYPDTGVATADAAHFYTYIPIKAGNYSMLVDSNLFGQSNALKMPLFNANKEYVGTLSNGTSPTSESSRTQEAHFTVTQSQIDWYGAVYFGYSEYNPVISQLMIVEDSTYPAEYIPHVDKYVLSNVEYDVSTSKQITPNALYHKKVVFDGDSICEGLTEGSATKKGWPYRIGTANEMDYYNTAVGGGTITAETYNGNIPRHWVSRYIDTIHTNHPTLDYLILEGGTNDADILRETLPESLGTLDITDFSGEYDDTNFTGALDQLFFKATSYYPNAKIGFIIAQKMGVTQYGYSPTNNRRKFFERAMEVCNKWGIPYINLWDGCPLNPSLTAYYNTVDTTNNSYVDGQHLTSKGYDIITPKIEAWMRTL